MNHLMEVTDTFYGMVFKRWSKKRDWDPKKTDNHSIFEICDAINRYDINVLPLGSFENVLYGQNPPWWDTIQSIVGDNDVGLAVTQSIMIFCIKVDSFLGRNIKDKRDLWGAKGLQCLLRGIHVLIITLVYFSASFSKYLTFLPFGMATLAWLWCV